MRLSLEQKIWELSKKWVIYIITFSENEWKEKFWIIVRKWPYPWAFYISSSISNSISRLYNDIITLKKPICTIWAWFEEL